MKTLGLLRALEDSKTYVIQTLLFNQIKTGNPLIDTFMTTIILGLFSWLFTWFYDNHLILFSNFSFFEISSLFLKKNVVIIEGEKNTLLSEYCVTANTSTFYSERFKAILNHIVNNIEHNNSIYKIKESCSLDLINPLKKLKYDLFIVQQNNFKINEHIYVKCTIIEKKGDGQKSTTITEKITLNIYSYKYSMKELIQYLDKITEKYLSSIKENKINNRYIYSLESQEVNKGDITYIWNEILFDSSRSFNNIFFDGKKELIEKIDFFINNKKWYYDKGIPYSLGIGLHGPPGTGKTSFIKALANYTNRHIIIISLKLIKTKCQLEKIFFENTYHNSNDKNSISWDKKIIVFEDIDCIGDIVEDREQKNKEIENKKIIDNTILHSNINNIKVKDIISTINETTKNENCSIINENNKITLDDILNLWDGIRETPGRIMIITSNFYEKLDYALIRPGRIDISHKLNNASHKTIAEIYSHLFNEKIDITSLKKIKEDFYSPAELINIYVSNKNSNDFINRLLKNKKVL